MKPVSLFVISLVSLVAGTHTQAIDFSAGNKNWYAVAEDHNAMTVIALDPSAKENQPPRHVVGIVATYRRESFTEGGLMYVGAPYDYELSALQFDCSMPDHRYLLARDQFTLAGDKAASYGRSDGWLKSDPNDAVGKATWQAACKGAAASQLVARTDTHAAATRAFRQRLEARDAEAVAAKAGALQQRISPATSLAAATRSAHWHYTVSSDAYFEAVDIHGVSQGGSANRKFMSVATFWPEGDDMDFAVSAIEYDCAVPGRSRVEQVVGYAVKNGATTPVGTSPAPETEWSTARQGSYTIRAWDWACNGDKKTRALEGGSSFEAMLEMYRETLRNDAGN